MSETLGYRPCVGVMLVNGEGKVFVGRRIDNREGDWWQMPQGGVDEGEDLEDAALREIHDQGLGCSTGWLWRCATNAQQL